MRNEIKARIEILEGFVEANEQIIKREKENIANADSAKKIQESVKRIEKYIRENETYNYTIKVLKIILTK